MAKQFLEKIKAKLRYVVTIGLSVLTVFVIYKVFRTTQATEAWMCNSNGYAIRIIDDSVTSEVRSIKAVNDPYFKSFITSLTDYISAKFSKTKPCQGNSREESRINLIFVRLPLVTSGDEPLKPPPGLPTSRANITCRLDSPWVQLAIRRSSSPIIDAVFVWNERQFLWDQVLLSGQRPSLTQPLIPLGNRLFQQYAADYAGSEIMRSPSGENPQPSISKRIPADVLWLFRHSWQSTRGPFSNIAQSAMRKTVEQGANGYTNLTKILVDQCFISSKTEIRYKNVLDLQQILTLDQYRINRLY
ncbi:hypothetical protein MTo_04364 [Microcystis aeruginosa NIES-1211]|jgi:hypothetical protein|uniref:hypothetical protein n=1 Tax=Microcystis TaxID=1125 RepID=UPI000D7C81A4|nr:hypothetical protein [Microcystis aeruginosa]GBL17037.1 hypothetical protein MTo_04364 [Microcystis aeruginosa NIES-1211]